MVGIISDDQQLAKKLYRTISEKLQRSKVYLSYQDKILGPNIKDMQLTNKYNNGIRFLLCVVINTANMFRLSK